METENQQNEILRKIGRNVVLFQHVENTIKELLILHGLSGHGCDLENIKGRRKATVHKQTLGQVAKQWQENAYSNPNQEESTNAPEEFSKRDMWFSFKFNFDSDIDFYEERKNALALLVAERNNLIHHLLPKWNPGSIESCIEIEQYLDFQREKISSEFKFFQHLIKTHNEFVKFIQTNEGIKQINLSLLQQSQFISQFFQFAQQRARSDGWANLSTAASYIRQQTPEAVANLKERYGYKKLKDIILATGYFDIRDEPTDKGGIRVVFRIKPS